METTVALASAVILKHLLYILSSITSIFSMQGAWIAKPSIEEVSEYIKNRQSNSEN